MSEGSLLLVALLFAAYMLPGLIAERRKHPQRWPLLIINAAFGWTMIGWIGCLAWSVWSFEREQPR